MFTPLKNVIKIWNFPVMEIFSKFVPLHGTDIAEKIKALPEMEGVANGI